MTPAGVQQYENTRRVPPKSIGTIGMERYDPQEVLLIGCELFPTRYLVCE